MLAVHLPELHFSIANQHEILEGIAFTWSRLRLLGLGRGFRFLLSVGSSFLGFSQLLLELLQLLLVLLVQLFALLNRLLVLVVGLLQLFESLALFGHKVFQGIKLIIGNGAALLRQSQRSDASGNQAANNLWTNSHRKNGFLELRGSGVFHEVLENGLGLVCRKVRPYPHVREQRLPLCRRTFSGVTFRMTAITVDGVKFGTREFFRARFCRLFFRIVGVSGGEQNHGH
jgi:hypothetical protein